MTAQAISTLPTTITAIALILGVYCISRSITSILKKKFNNYSSYLTFIGLTQINEKTNRKGRKGHVRAACALAHRDKSFREFLRKSCFK
jgi:hypothetical protein